MNCSDVHLSLGAEPSATSPELEAHVRDCAACARFRSEMLRLDEGIRRALMIDVSALKADEPARTNVHAGPWTDKALSGAATSAPYSRSRHWALAASVLLAVAVVLVMWGALPRHSLAADVVSHVVSETIDQPLEGPVDEADVRSVMEQAGLRLDAIDPSIVFMRTCFIRGRLVPHFIVRTADGMATVMILPDEHVKAAERFDGSGYKGVLVPDANKGTIAVLSRADVDLDRYAAEIRRAVHALPAKAGS
ncbi:MAG: DUF3379 family protein [Gammaproteobacteria bacterium]